MQLDNDALADHRHWIVMKLSLLGGPILFAVALMHAVAQRWPMVVLNMVVAMVLLATGWLMFRGRRPLMPSSVLIALMAVAVCMSIRMQGMAGVLWAYPLMFLSYFALPRRLATVLVTVLLLAVTLVCMETLEGGFAVRVFLSMGFVLLMINVVLNVVGSLQQALIRQAITDPLTGAFNRRHLQIHLDSLTPRTGVVSGAVPASALLAVDIDLFKHINDRHGHDTGDLVLRRMVELLNSRKRASDLLFRTGGEEFMLLLPRIDAEDAVGVAEDLRLLIAKSNLLPGQVVTVSIGVSLLTAGQTAQAWMKQADNALYAAKRAGRNCVRLAGPIDSEAGDGHAALDPAPDR